MGWGTLTQLPHGGYNQATSARDILMQQARPTGKCWCGCGEQTSPGKFFAHYHDGKAYGCLRKLHNGALRNDGLANMLLALGYDDENGVCCAANEKP